MTRKERLQELLSKKRRNYEEDRELKNLQSQFISKSKVNPRIFDSNFEKINKKYSGINRRENGGKKENGRKRNVNND